MHQGYKQRQGIQGQHSPCTSTWLQAAVQIIKISNYSVITHAMKINIDSRYNRTKDWDIVSSSSTDPDISLASGGSVVHSDQYGSNWQQNPWTSAWLHLSMEPNGIHMAFCCNIVQGYQYISHWQQYLKAWHAPLWQQPPYFLQKLW